MPITNQVVLGSRRPHLTLHARTDAHVCLCALVCTQRGNKTHMATVVRPQEDHGVQQQSSLMRWKARLRAKFKLMPTIAHHTNATPRHATPHATP